MRDATTILVLTLLAAAGTVIAARTGRILGYTQRTSKSVLTWWDRYYLNRAVLKRVKKRLMAERYGGRGTSESCRKP